MKRAVVYALPFFVYFLTLMVVGHIPVSAQLNVWGHVDKVYHFVAYTLLAVLLLRCLRGYGYRGRYLPVLLLGLVYAALDEASQALVPGRDVSLADFLANAAGFGAGYYLFRRLIVHRQGNKSSGV